MTRLLNFLRRRFRSLTQPVPLPDEQRRFDAEQSSDGTGHGGALELVSTPEDVLERRRQATLTTGEDGLPLVRLDEGGTVSNTDATKAIHDQRADR